MSFFQAAEMFVGFFLVFFFCPDGLVNYYDVDLSNRLARFSAVIPSGLPKKGLALHHME